MAKGFTLEKHMRVYDDDVGHYVKVGVDADGFGCVCISTEGPSADYFGPLHIALQPDMARLLARALTEVADSLEQPK